jgi:hypothetical protein
MKEPGPPLHGEPDQEFKADGKAEKYPAAAASATIIRIDAETAQEIANLICLFAAVGEPEQAIGLVCDLADVLAGVGLDFEYLARIVHDGLKQEAS